MTPLRALVALAGAAALLACGAEGSNDVIASCGANQPIECRSPEGTLQGCCPNAHPVCSLDGKSCGDFNSGGGGSGNAGGSGGNPGGGASGAGASGGSGGATGGTGGSAGSSGGAAGTATGGTGASCDDPNEPDDDEDSAHYLGAIDDCDGSGASVTGVLSGKDDVDWLRFYGNDTFGCVVDPYVESSVKARVCVFAECASAQVSCSGSSPATSPGGRPGCCAPQGGQISVSLGCNGTNDSASVYVRVDNPTQDICQQYSLNYHY